MISWQEQHPWKTDTSPNALWGLTTLPRIFTRQLLIPDFCLRQLFSKMFSLVFLEPWLYPQRGEEIAWFPAEPITLSVEQQSPGAPPAQLPCGAPSPWPCRGVTDMSLCFPLSQQLSTEQSSHLTLGGLCNPALAVSHHPCLLFDVHKWMLLKGTCWARDKGTRFTGKSGLTLYKTVLCSGQWWALVARLVFRTDF